MHRGYSVGPVVLIYRLQWRGALCKWTSHVDARQGETVKPSKPSVWVVEFLQDGKWVIWEMHAFKEHALYQMKGRPKKSWRIRRYERVKE